MSALLCCPTCKSDLRVQDTSMTCLGCGNLYPVEEGIPILIQDRAKPVEATAAQAEKS